MRTRATTALAGSGRMLRALGPANTRRFAALMGVAVLPLSLVAGTAYAAPVAKPKQQGLEGTISWTVWTTEREQEVPQFGTTYESTIEENFSLRVDAVRDPSMIRRYGFKPSRAPFSYTYDATSVARDHYFGQVICEATTNDNASVGEMAPYHLQIFGQYKPNDDVLVIDRRTKGISFSAFTTARGETSTVQKGFGVNGCQPGSRTDSFQMLGSTSSYQSQRDWLCVPDGLKLSAWQSPLLGKWNNKKKRFDFKCTKTFSDSMGKTMKIAVNGSLKYRR